MCGSTPWLASPMPHVRLVEQYSKWRSRVHDFRPRLLEMLCDYCKRKLLWLCGPSHSIEGRDRVVFVCICPQATLPCEYMQEILYPHDPLWLFSGQYSSWGGTETGNRSVSGCVLRAGNACLSRNETKKLEKNVSNVHMRMRRVAPCPPSHPPAIIQPRGLCCWWPSFGAHTLELSGAGALVSTVGKTKVPGN